MSKIILYVEDDSLSREIMEFVLDDLPEYELITFSDSENFEQRVAALRDVPVLVLLDIHVPPHNGFEMLEMLRQMPSMDDVPILALTASVMNEEVKRLKQAGFNGAIAKPIDQDKFANYITQAISGQRIWSIITHIE